MFYFAVCCQRFELTAVDNNNAISKRVTLSNEGGVLMICKRSVGLLAAYTR
jgi:hypothetical protein